MNNILEDKNVRPDPGPEGGGSGNGGVPVNQTSPHNLFTQEAISFEYAFAPNHFDDVMTPSSSNTKQNMSTIQQSSNQHQHQIVDDDVFQCGKCKQRFFQLDYFFDHKGQCKVFTNSPIAGGMLSDETKLTSGANYASTSHQQHQDGLSSLLSNTVVDNDLLSLTSSFDTSSLLGLSNSISPASLLHLQSGDISATAEDFVSFHQLAAGGDQASQQVGINTESSSAVIEHSARQQAQQQHTLQVHQTSHGQVHHSSTLYTNEPSTGSMKFDGFYDIMTIDSSNESTNLLKSSFDPTLSSVGVLDQDSRSSNILVSPVSDYYTNTLVSSTPGAGTSTPDQLSGNNLVSSASFEKAPTVMVEHRPQSTTSSGSSTNYEMMTIAPDMVFQLIEQPTENNNISTASTPNTSSSSLTTKAPEAISSVFFPKVKLEVFTENDVDKKTLETNRDNKTTSRQGKTDNKMKVNQCVECNRKLFIFFLGNNNNFPMLYYKFKQVHLRSTEIGLITNVIILDFDLICA